MLKDRKIYFEKQSQDRLCGLHCLNSLLQGPFFDVVQLSDIALELDKKESLLLNKQQHENVDVDGNYNVQVLTEALLNHGTTIKSISQNQVNSLLTNKMDTIQAFIFNSSTHWFCIRRINNIWYDLNSTNKTPKKISDFFLSAFVLGTMDIGYTNFLVENLPELPDEDYYLELQKHQMLFTSEEIDNLNKDKENKEKDNGKEDKDDGTFKAFQGKGTVLDDGHAFDDFGDEDADDEMKKVMEMSLNSALDDLKKDLPREPEDSDKSTNIFTIVFRYQEKSFQRRFFADATIGSLKLFCKYQLKTLKHIELFESFPRKVYSNNEETLEKSGLSKQQILMTNIF